MSNEAPEKHWVIGLRIILGMEEWEMHEVRSCGRCMYGPNMLACHMGRTGNSVFRQSLSERLEMNPFRPNPARDSTGAFLQTPSQMPCFLPQSAESSDRASVQVKGIVALLMPIVVASMGFVMGIVPGLLLGLIGWHEAAAIIIPVIWCIGYIRQRSRRYGDVGWTTFCVGGFGGLGLGIAIWFFGNVAMGS